MRTPLPESQDVTFTTVARVTDLIGTGELGENFETVVKDLEFRAEQGEAKYGVRLHTYNGRDPLIDLYEELLDALVYSVQYGLESEGDPYCWELPEAVLDSLGVVVQALNRRTFGLGYLRGRAPQPAPLFDRPIEQYL